MIGHLLLERIPLAGIARVVGVSERWLQTYVNRIYQRVPRRVVKHRPGTRLCLEYPLGHKWLALDRNTRAIVGVHIGDRSRAGAQALWDSLPESYGYTNHIERFNNTLRHRVSRLVRQSLAFSKKMENHIGAIWLFVHHYNFSKLDFL